MGVTTVTMGGMVVPGRLEKNSSIVTWPKNKKMDRCVPGKPYPQGMFLGCDTRWAGGSRAARNPTVTDVTPT